MRLVCWAPGPKPLPPYLLFTTQELIKTQLQLTRASQKASQGNRGSGATWKSKRIPSPLSTVPMVMDIGWEPTIQTHTKGPRAQICPTVLEAGLRVTLKLLLIFCSNAVTTQHGNLLTQWCPTANPSVPLLSVWCLSQHRSPENSAEEGILTPDLCIRPSVVVPTIRVLRQALQRC